MATQRGGDLYCECDRGKVGDRETEEGGRELPGGVKPKEVTGNGVSWEFGQYREEGRLETFQSERKKRDS